MVGDSHNKVVAAVARALSRPWVQLLLVVLLGILVYSNSFDVPFLFDDEGSITDNPIIRNLDSFLGGEGYHNSFNYNPRRFVGYLTLALNYRIGGLDVTGYHAVNLAIHIACALLVYALVRGTLQTPFFRREGEAGALSQASAALFIPFCAALLFVAHPVQTQAVTYIVQRLASLCTMFYLASLVCYARARILHDDGRGTRSIPFYALSLAAALLAIATKEIAATLPFLIAAYEFSFFNRNRRRKLQVILPVLVVFAVIVPAAMIGSGKPLDQLLSDVSALTRETTTISRADYLVTQFSVIVTYLRLLVLPVGQNLDYDYPVYHSLLEPRPALSLLLLVILASVGVMLYLKSRQGREGTQGSEPLFRLAGFGVLWFFVALSVESSVIPIRDVIYEHRLYLPSIGLFTAVAVFLWSAVRKVQLQLIATVAGVFVVVLAGASYARNEVWRSDISLWSDVAEKSPNKGRSHHNLARAYKEHGMLAEAEAQYLVALRLNPTNSETYTNLGVIYRRQGRVDQAIEMHLKSMDYGGKNPAPRLNLGVVYASQQRYREAEALFLEALTLDPKYAEAHFNLALLYALQGDSIRAEQEYRSTLVLDPLYAQADNALGILCVVSGRVREGETYLRRAVALRPDNRAFAADLAKLAAYHVQ
jgi:protein O-mannosyl-transferase